MTSGGGDQSGSGGGRSPLEPIASFGQTSPVTPAKAHRPATPFGQGASPVRGGAYAAPLSATPSAPPATTLLQLLWLDPDAAGRLRRHPQWRSIVDAAEEAPDQELEEALGVVHRSADQPRAVFDVLCRGTPCERADLPNALRAAARPDGRFVPPLVLVAGALVLPFDPVARLRATHAVITPLAAADTELRAALDYVTPYLDRPEAAGGADALTQYLLTRSRDKTSRLPKGQLEEWVQRTLLEQRAYEKRNVLGDNHVRGLVWPDAPAVAYLPIPAAGMMPLLQSTPVRALAEVYPTQDEAESQGPALRVRALARVCPV